jgi:CheY-like chemotaxis protein
MKQAELKSAPLVMIADHDEEERAILKAVLKLKGFQVVEAANGQQAITLANKSTPNLLLVDSRLPSVSAATVIRQIKSQAQLRNLNVTAVSLSTVGSKAWGANCSAAHLRKPVEFDQLIALIDRLLHPPHLQPAQT